MAGFPPLLAGPVLRHCHQQQLTLWFVTSSPARGAFQTFDNNGHCLLEQPLETAELNSVQVGQHCFIHLLRVQASEPLPGNTLLSYELQLDTDEGRQGLTELAPGLLYPGQPRPVFQLPKDGKLSRLLHGSCRKPHHYQSDAMITVDNKLHRTLTKAEQRPDLLLFSGDQVYVDDVAGPMLVAVHQVIDKLGLFDENWQGADCQTLAELRQLTDCYYGREGLLPDDKANQALMESFFEGARKPIFTSAGAHNHLVALSEVIAMYLLAWSDTPWQWVDLDIGEAWIGDSYKARYERECATIDDFADGVKHARRAMAHIPVYMIFDDHDVTDDWNLTRGWEEAAYGNPFSRRIIGNALVGYWLCQGWGNQPDNYQHLAEQVLPCFTDSGIEEHDNLIDAVLNWKHWHYHLNTSPKLVVLDTRTHRWRSESSPGKPSGLMDWETLSELQQELIGQESVIMVSPAPVFGVKLIETIQRVFTFFGKPLVVDAENWMAHPGAANVILNIFRHQKTPPRFIILSGDVHYSFAYDVTLRFRQNSPQILQITASGIKNAFPDRLLRWFDRINRWLYGSRSPLNVFTKRRRMKIKRRTPNGGPEVLFNHAAIGEVELAQNIEETQVRVHTSDGEVVEFK
ncbi:hypothetical protein HMF8227_02793 [Saliniradius amylolyticus]|uniref:Alkaline phosphatase family protein n=1 Tax=Saliniradius amylolyticus TaxID=2183582 RepID=A0A2S2E6U5_9ALTE|nr:alkaline phosphatase D family protein [Saliniradius amylolyticus]AWL13242.1 hypothetical protein HMF8227_02793 [Saliniradius amylolyticus]